MDERIKRLAQEEAKKMNISTEAFIELAEVGCNMVFGDGLSTRIKVFGLDMLPDDEIRVMLLTLAQGGALAKAADDNPN